MATNTESFIYGEIFTFVRQYNVKVLYERTYHLCFCKFEFMKLVAEKRYIAYAVFNTANHLSLHEPVPNVDR